MIVVVVEALLDRVDVIDMSNPNMSRDDRARLTDEVLCCSIDDDDDDDDDNDDDDDDDDDDDERGGSLQ